MNLQVVVLGLRNAHLRIEVERGVVTLWSRLLPEPGILPISLLTRLVIAVPKTP